METMGATGDSDSTDGHRSPTGSAAGDTESDSREGHRPGPGTTGPDRETAPHRSHREPIR